MTGLLLTVAGGFLAGLLTVAVQRILSESWRARVSFLLRTWWRGPPKPLAFSWKDLNEIQRGAYRLDKPQQQTGERAIQGSRLRAKGRVLEIRPYYSRRAFRLATDVDGVEVEFLCVLHPYGCSTEAYASLDAFCVEVEGTIRRIVRTEPGNPLLLDDCHLIRRRLLDTDN